jgi:transcriptional regulator with XRE-family HTH domain
MSKSLRTQRHRALVSALIAARKDAGLSQRALAARMKVSQSLIASIENRERRLDVIEFLDLCKALDLSPGEYLSRISTR